MTDLFDVVMGQLGELLKLFRAVPLSLFKEGNNGTLATFFATVCGGGVVFKAMWERWKK